jgi:single-strand DNA-binding protein
MELKGKIKKIEILENDKYPKALVVLVTDEEKYPQTICVEFSEKQIPIVRNYEIGESVIISININGREWVNDNLETKYFTTIKGWKITKN